MTHEINIADFAAFCRSKGEETFDIYRCKACALGQFALENGATYVGDSFFLVGGDRFAMPTKAYSELCMLGGGDGNASFSALADRLDALMETADA